MRLGRLFCSLILFVISAIAAHAQTPINPSSLAGADPTISVRSPDPACGGCVDLTYTGSAATEMVFFFAAPSPIVIPPDYSCVVDPSSTNPINCAAVDELNSMGQPVFTGVDLTVFGLFSGETFSFSATGGTVELIVPGGEGFGQGGTMILGPTPEPGTALLFVTGLVFLVGFTRKRFGGNFLT